MKKHSSSSTEQQGKQLWAGFNVAQSDAFWQKYEKLLQTNQAQAYQKRQVFDQQQKALAQIGKKVFHPHSVFITKKILWLTLLVFLFTRGMVAIMLPQTTGEIIYFVAVVVVFNGIIAFLMLWMVNSFEVNEQSLVIRNPLLFTKRSVSWQQIESISIKPITPLIPHEDAKIRHNLILKTTKAQFTRGYRLSLHDHKDFFTALSKKTADVNPGGYTGYQAN